MGGGGWRWEKIKGAKVALQLVLRLSARPMTPVDLHMPPEAGQKQSQSQVQIEARVSRLSRSQSRLRQVAAGNRNYRKQRG